VPLLQEDRIDRSAIEEREEEEKSRHGENLWFEGITENKKSGERPKIRNKV